MNTLSTEQRATLQGSLEQEKKNLEKRLAELKIQDPFNDPERLIDNASNDTEANEESTHDRYAAMMREITMKLTDISEALARINDGTYGTCANCGKPVGVERIAAIPTAKFCVACGNKR